MKINFLFPIFAALIQGLQGYYYGSGQIYNNYAGYSGQQLAYSNWPYYNSYQQAMNTYQAYSSPANFYQRSANFYQYPVNQNDAIIQMIRQYAPYQSNDESGNKIMYQGYNGEQVLYIPPSTYSSNYFTQAPMMDPRSSVISEQQGYNPYTLKLYQTNVQQAFDNTMKLPEVNGMLFKFLDAVSPYHFLNNVPSDPFDDLLKNADNTKNPFVKPPFIKGA